MKKSILFLSIVAFTLGVYADPVSADDAKIAAAVWVVKNAAFGASGSATNVVTVADPNNSSVTLWHQVYMDNGGMLIVAPRTEIEPVIYALDNTPKTMTPTLRAILTHDVRRRLEYLGLYPSKARTAKSAEEQATAREWGEVNHAKWERLMAVASTPMPTGGELGLQDITVNVCTVKGFEKGGKLTHWNQVYGKDRKPLYNFYVTNLVSKGESARTPVGCVATAVSAIMQFFGPTNAVKVEHTCSYSNTQTHVMLTNKYETIPGPIDWSILDNFNPNDGDDTTLDVPTDKQRELIGRVAYNAAVGVEMNWADDQSGAPMSLITRTLKEIFGFKHARTVMIPNSKAPSQEHLEKLLYNHLRAGVPVGLGIAGHAIVAVGYGVDHENIERVRLFMGWGGADDGWYALPLVDTNANPGGNTYVSDIVDMVNTMIAYDNDDIVPVVGRVVDLERKPKANATITFPGVLDEKDGVEEARTITTDENGYFGTLVPMNLTEDACKMTCANKTATFDIGADIAETIDDEAALEAEGADGDLTNEHLQKAFAHARRLAKSVPTAFEFPILGCTVAYSAEDAKALAEAEGKAIFHVRGYLHETNASEVLSYVYGLAGDADGDFAQNFVYFFSHAYSAKEDGNVVSYGTYHPSNFGFSEDGEIASGALTYGYLKAEDDVDQDALLDDVDGVITVGTTLYAAVPVPVEGASSVISIAPNGSGAMVVTVAVKNGLAGFKYELKFSDDLVNWTTVEKATPKENGQVDLVGYAAPSTETPMQFFKLVVTMEESEF